MANAQEEVKEAAENLDADVVVFDNSLTPSQLRNLQDELNKPILDRTSLILDIFERRARTREAKLQVECAKLKYLEQPRGRRKKAGAGQKKD